MTSRQVGRVNQQSKGETPLSSGVLQRAAVRAVADKEGEATQEMESGRLSQSRFVHDFSQVPIDRGGLSKEVSKTPNQTGLPDNLKAGVENLSGYSLDDVRVHYNSPKPAQLQALAYTQGTEIHVAPGQEKHLPHEAWHVVQQKQGRVKPTVQAKGVAINDNQGLEKEADVMGERAARMLFYESVKHGTKSLEVTDQRAGIPVNSEKVPLNFLSTVQLSSAGGVVNMPGLSKNKNNKRKERNGNGDDKNRDSQQSNKRVTRASIRTYDLNRPRFEFTSTYAGVSTQKLNTTQRISFEQNATLYKPAGAPMGTASYYDFRQEVRDGFGSHPRNTGYNLEDNFVQDGPFRPPYNNDNINTNPGGFINFDDNPGFSGDRQIPIGQWLNWYEVRFRWKVRLKDPGHNAANEWISPEIRHRVDSAYNAGNDVQVTHSSSPDAEWLVNLS